MHSRVNIDILDIYSLQSVVLFGILTKWDMVGENNLNQLFACGEKRLIIDLK